jgi:hypothetical protein
VFYSNWVGGGGGGGAGGGGGGRAKSGSKAFGELLCSQPKAKRMKQPFDLWGIAHFINLKKKP